MSAPPARAIPRGRALRWRLLVLAAALLLAAPAVASASATEARWADRDHAATTASTATVPTIAVTGCTARPGNVARFALQRGQGTLVPTLYAYEIRAVGALPTAPPVASGTFPASQTSFDVSVGALALLQRYTVSFRALAPVPAGTWESATLGVGHVDVTLGLLLWSCGAGA